MKYLASACLLLTLAAAACDEPTGPYDNLDRWVLVELDGRALPVRYRSFGSTADTVFADTLYLNVRVRRAVHVMTVNGGSERTRMESDLEVVPNDQLAGFGLDFHCTYPGGCLSVRSPTPAEFRGDTLLFANTYWNFARRYVRR